MNKYRNNPMFIMNDGGGAAQERFDFVAVSASRQTIADHTKAAIATLEKGTATVNGAFGTNGAAMRGGSSNYVNTKWNSLTAAFANFSKYIDGTLEKVQIASKSNESFEDKVQTLFAQLGMEDDAQVADVPVADATTSMYS